jgi:hypothetical protein
MPWYKIIATKWLGKAITRAAESQLDVKSGGKTEAVC